MAVCAARQATAGSTLTGVSKIDNVDIKGGIAGSLPLYQLRLLHHLIANDYYYRQNSSDSNDSWLSAVKMKKINPFYRGSAAWSSPGAPPGLREG